MIKTVSRSKVIHCFLAVSAFFHLGSLEGYLSPQQVLSDFSSEDTGHFYSGDYTLSYTCGQGLGYSRGYGSVDIFIPMPIWENQVLSFLDLRGHMLTNGNPAYNAGAGVRWLDKCNDLVWGTYGFYDYYQTSHRPYHQATLGVEMMAECWEFRVNGYLPVGRTKTDLYSFYYRSIDPEDFLVKGRMELALKGFDAELGYHIAAFSCFNFYMGIGPYVYWGKTASTENAFDHKHVYSVGGNARINSTFFEYIVVNLEVSYDTLYKWTAQATFGVDLPFDFFDNSQAHTIYSIADKLYDDVLRNEIIVTKKVSRHSRNPLILDPNHEP